MLAAQSANFVAVVEAEDRGGKENDEELEARWNPRPKKGGHFPCLSMQA